jgi:hypothetical protein
MPGPRQRRTKSTARTIFEHITHCSPCYREFLEAREGLRAEEAAKPETRMSWFRQRRLGKSLDKLEKVVKSAAQEVRRR